MEDFNLPTLDELVKHHSLRGAIRAYIKKSVALKERLDRNPQDWVKFQDEINKVVDSVSLEMANFEREHGLHEEKIYRLKRFFIQRLRKYFLHGHYITWSLNKPYGYAGDFKIIDDIYLNHPASSGFERLWDNYFLRMGPSIATRNRKEDFKKIILDQVGKHHLSSFRVMDLASGPCRELKELLTDYPDEMSRVVFDCYDFDDHAIQYAQTLLDNSKRVNFFKKNALRLALKKDIQSEIPHQYDLIFSTGLFDYLDERVAARLLTNLKRLLNDGGLLCISNYRAKDANPWAHLMEWIAEWNLVYRSEEEFVPAFTAAGFDREHIQIQYEPLKIMQYFLARNR